MKRGGAILLASSLALALAAGGCGSGEKKTPDACRHGAAPYLAALRNAPGSAELPGGVPIGSCLTPNQSAADLGAVGSAMIHAATLLNGRALRDPGGRETVALGYLVGAAEAAGDANNGIDADLIRRLRAGAEFSPHGTLPPPFKAAYERGIEAGNGSG